MLTLKRNFGVHLHAKNEPHSYFLFWDIVKILQPCYFKYLENARSCLSIIKVSPYLMQKVLISTCRKLWCLSACEKSTSYLTSFLRYWKDIANLLFGNFGNAWPSTSKSQYQFVKNFHAYLHAKNQLNYSLLSKDIAKK